LPVAKLAEWAGTISYEIMTSISQRVKRVYTNG
jgi:Alr-MurF fusion protein